MGSIGDVLVKELRGYLGCQQQETCLLVVAASRDSAYGKGYAGGPWVPHAMLLVRRRLGTQLFRTRVFQRLSGARELERAARDGLRALGPQDAADRATIVSALEREQMLHVRPEVVDLFVPDIYGGPWSGCSLQSAVAAARAHASSGTIYSTDRVEIAVYVTSDAPGSTSDENQ